MKSLEQMLEMDFENASTYFKGNQAQESEKWEYINAVGTNETLDCRDDGISKNVLDNLIDDKAFLLITGVSGTGKTTLAKRFKKQYGNKVAILDIDEVCKDYSMEVKKKVSPFQFMFFLHDFDRQCDYYIDKNLEQLVVKASKNGSRSVILVGLYLHPIAKAIVNYTLGKKHFPFTATINIHERLETIIQRVAERDDGIVRVSQIQSEYQIVENILKFDVNCLGIGADLSIFVNSKTQWWC